MSVDCSAGIAYGVRVSADDLRYGLEKYINSVTSIAELSSSFEMTNEEFEKWKKDYNFSEILCILEEEENILIRVNNYTDDGDYIVGYSLAGVEFGCCEQFNISDSLEYHRRNKKLNDRILKLISLLDINQQPDLVLYCQVW